MGTTATTATTTNTSGRGEVFFEGGRRALLVEISFTMSSSYATGGDTLSLPTTALKLGRELEAVIILNPLDGTRIYQWDGNKTTPKIQAFTGLAAEVAATTNLSAVAARKALLLYTG